MKFFVKAASGSDGFDRMVDWIRLGDNVVWQIDDIEGYSRLALDFARKSAADGHVTAYIRFGRHAAIIPEGEPGVLRYDLDANIGFEQFTGRVHQIITDLGLRAFYVFDCLSDLVDDWATDLMIGNFFVATCPYLFDLETVAWFGVMRGRHSTETIARIRETTQLFLDLYGAGDGSYVQPLKVWKRYSSTMFLPHRVSGGEFLPLTSSADAAAFFRRVGSGALRGGEGKLDSWDRLFQNAEALCAPGADEAAKNAMKDDLCARLCCRDERIVTLAREWFSLEDLIEIKRRMIGTGYAGGKAAGMLLARKIVESRGLELESHDSFYVGSDVFYTYLVQNGLWRLRMRQKSPNGYMTLSEELRQGLARGAFPEGIREQFFRMLEYFGQSPIIVRSSSLLEDGFGNAFAGKYESVFCANQGDLEARCHAFEEAVRTVYSSVMDESALSYRLRMGLADADEQMALLVQRVSGSFHGRYFFPLVAGVADSRNMYVWREGLDAKAGMLRLVLGLGTRAVDRTGDDWPRLVALDDPSDHPYHGTEEIIRHSQKQLDVLDLEMGGLGSIPLEEALAVLDGAAPAADFSARDYQAEEHVEKLGMPPRIVRYTELDGFINGSRLCGAMKPILAALEEAYGAPVDAEFTINPSGSDTGTGAMIGYNLNLLQCRPLAVHGPEGELPRIREEEAIDRDRIVVSFSGGTMGGGFERPVSRLIYISPSAYIQLPPPERIALAQTVRRLNALIAERDSEFTVLLTPGRCGSTMSQLGLPVSFADICNFGAIGEMSDVSAGMAPELSYGSHFFRDLVETRIFYMAILAEHEGVIFRRELFLGRPNRLEELVPGSPYNEAMHVSDYPAGELMLRADLEGTTTMFFTR